MERVIMGKGQNNYVCMVENIRNDSHVVSSWFCC